MTTQSPVQGYVDPDFPNPNGPDDASIIIYALFAISRIFHSWQPLKYRTWYFSTILEIVSYIFRILSNRQDPYRVTYFVVQCFLIVVAPYAPISPRLVLTTFTTYDVVAIILKQKDPATANNIFLLFLDLPRLTGVLHKSMSWGFIAAFIAVALLIYLRVCFRLMGTAERLLSNLSTHEVYVGRLEFLPVVLAIYLLPI
ncbi:hypothetical protein V2W45_1472220 [Cenococcum geophilum]